MTTKSKFQQFNRYLINLQFTCLPVFKFYKAKIGWLANAGIKVGKDAKVNGHTLFYGDGNLEIGKETWVGPGCRFYTNSEAPIILGAHCDIAPEVSFITGSHEIGNEARRAGIGTAKEIVIEDGCWIGARVTILGGSHIGKSSIIAAGALVNEDIPENSLAAGVPARVIKKLPLKETK
ncbi:MAG: transferase [Anaerolinea sp.]|nr:transferase [Anaerolinea sp.]